MNELEEGTAFTPKFDANGLIPCVVTSAKSGDVIMFAYMNAESLQKTLETGEAWYWSRSRKSLWHKGASSGLMHKVREMRVDCDQDCIWISVDIPGTEETGGAEASCHTGRKGCFYRVVPVQKGSDEVQLEFIDAEKIFDPDKVYDQ